MHHKYPVDKIYVNLTTYGGYYPNQILQENTNGTLNGFDLYFHK